jgi:hypothetical protein
MTARPPTMDLGAAFTPRMAIGKALLKAERVSSPIESLVPF